MSIRMDASTDQLNRTAGNPTITSCTLMGWIYAVGAGSIQSALSIGAANAVDFYHLGRDATASRLQIYNGLGTVNGTAAFATTTWAHVALTCAGTSTGQLLGYLNGVLDITTNARTQPTNAKAYVGSSDGGDWFNGRVAAVKFYSAVLTADELKLEMRCYTPVRTANLNTWSPLMTATETTNYVGTTAWTVGGTLTTEDGPPIPWSLRPGFRAARATVAAPAGKAFPPYRHPWRTWRRVA